MTKPSNGARARLRAYFLAHVGEVLDGDTLREVAGGISEWARRIRELRNEEGMDIHTNKDRSDLLPSQYILVGTKPKPAFERSISKETRALVLDRNGFTCQMCGTAAGEPHPYDAGRKTRLHLGHIIDKSSGGSDDATNLRAICSVCNEGASNVTAMRPDLVKLLAQVRRATGADQLKVLQWLAEKYPNQTSGLADIGRAAKKP
jgi:5-methylcytosine-specific restriction endonuclease McrA